MTVIWSRRAIRHLSVLRAYIERDSEQHAARVATRILTAVELLQSQPELGRPGRVVGTSELIVPDTPYIIPYRVRHDRLELMAVFHGRQSGPRNSNAPSDFSVSDWLAKDRLQSPAAL